MHLSYDLTRKGGYAPLFVKHKVTLPKKGVTVLGFGMTLALLKYYVELRRDGGRTASPATLRHANFSAVTPFSVEFKIIKIRYIINVIFNIA